MSRRSLALAGLALTPLVVASPANAWCRTTTSNATPANPGDCITAGVPLFWATRCQTFSIDAQSGGGLDLATVRAATTASFATWNAVTCGSTSVFSVIESATTVDCRKAEYSSDDGNSNTIAFIDDFGARMYPDAIAVTIVWHNKSSGQIYDADMMINDAYGPFVQCGVSGCAPSETRFDLQNTITHEAGHFLGLAHSAVGVSTMYFSAQPGEASKRTLDADDEAGLCAAYGGGVVPAECDSTPRHGFDADCNVEPTANGRSGCGCSVGERPSGMLASLAALAALSVTAARRRRRGS